MLPVAYIFFLVNFTFGVFVKTGVIPPVRFRRFHHVLYFAVMASLAIAIIVDGFLHSYLPVALVLVFCLLLAMPLFRGGSRTHIVYAVVCLAVYTAIVVL